MMPYVLRFGAPGEGYTPYGKVREAFCCKDPEMILSGPADTGKTLGLLHKLHACACKYPGASIVIARKQLTDTYSTVLVTFREQVLGKNSPVDIYGGEKAQWFNYPNDSRIWVAGLDKPGKVLSAEHDIIYVNQAEEISLPDWETLTTRTTGRAGHIPYNQTIGDCNPGPPTHWIKSRARTGALTLIESGHKDNPELYEPLTGELTPEGEKRLGALKRLSGSRLQRLYHGLWAAPEGAIYDVFDEEKHKVVAFPPPVAWPRAVGIDPYGAFVAAVWVAWDPMAQMLNVYREYYEPFGVTTGGHAQNILTASRYEPVFAWVGGAPGERQQRIDFTGSGIPLQRPPVGDVWAGIDRVYGLLKDFKLVIHDCCVNLLSEIGSYRRKLRDGQPTERIEDKEAFHLLDALRYVITYLTDAQQTEVVYQPIQIGRDW